MKCPVCKTELHEGTTICPICEFDQFQTEFINQEEYLLWKRDIVSSYYTNYYKKVQSTFEISENTIISYKGNEKEIIIPYGITAIAPSAFSRRGLQKEILAKNIIFPDTLVCIGEQAFSGCKHINEIIVPDSVISIGEMAFSNCESLSRIKLSNNIASIRSYLFSGDINLQYIRIPERVFWIQDMPFCRCESLRGILFEASYSLPELEANSFSIKKGINLPFVEIFCKKNSQIETYFEGINFSVQPSELFPSEY